MIFALATYQFTFEGLGAASYHADSASAFPTRFTRDGHYIQNQTISAKTGRRQLFVSLGPLANAEFLRNTLSGGEPMETVLRATAGNEFTSSLAVQVFKDLEPKLKVLLDH